MLSSTAASKWCIENVIFGHPVHTLNNMQTECW